MSLTVKITGLADVERFNKKIGNIEKSLDPVIKKITRQSVRELIAKTPRNKLPQGSRGSTAQAWTKVVKLADSVYRIENKQTTSDKKRSIIDILDKGRGAIYPKPSNKRGLLYIPLRGKGRKAYGAKIEKGLKHGEDYVFAKMAKAYAGTLFLTKSIEKSTNALRKAVMVEILKK